MPFSKKMKDKTGKQENGIIFSFYPENQGKRTANANKAKA